MTALTRRSFMGRAAGAAVAGALAPQVRAGVAWGAPGGHVLVAVFLRGGMDGCSALVPAGDRHYFDARPTIAVPETEVLPVNKTFGLHPAMGAIHRHFRAGRVAFVPATGSSNDTRSHFEQQDFVERGGESRERTGWLTRHLLSRPDGNGGVLDALSLSGATPEALRAAPKTVAAADLRNFGLDGFAKSQQDAARGALEALYGGRVGSTILGESATSLFDAFDTLARLKVGARAPRNGAAYPRSRLGRTLAQLGVVLHSGIGVDVATVDVSGWDTHDAMGTFAAGRMRMLLKDLSDSLGAFLTDLGSRTKDVTVVVHSEFGRRVAENGNQGTDHGRGGLMMILGKRVRAGVHGDWPGIAPRQRDRGDVAMANDYRNVLAEVLAGPVGNPRIDAVFPSLRPSFLGVTR